MNRLLKIAFGLAVFIVITIAVGMYIGRSNALDVKERLRPLWPDIEAMRQDDRALLGYLSLECKLLEKSDSRSETLACLRSVVNSDDMKKLTPDPPARLERLIERAAPVKS